MPLSRLLGGTEMPFPTGYDASNPADVLILKNEMNGTHDAVSALMGYDPSKGVQQDLNLINLSKNNAESPTPTTGQLLVSDLLAAIDPGELSANQVDNRSLDYVAWLTARELETDISAYIDKLTGQVFETQAPATLAAILASLRDQARYEVLYGVNTLIINKDQWRAARDS